MKKRGSNGWLEEETVTQGGVKNNMYNIFFSTFTENMPDALNAITSAMKEWQTKTCIRFVKRTSHQDYLWFFRQKG